ncbi:MAG: hypothetical protein KDL31_01735 [Kiritimatiellae bacterium]|nr:hypothetical protein [Kiritimatiellia bacterium]
MKSGFPRWVGHFFRMQVWGLVPLVAAWVGCTFAVAEAALVKPTTLSIDPYHRADITSPLVLKPRHSVDFQDMNGQISDAEIALTIGLWQSSEYHLSPSTELGYAAGAGSQTGIVHSADQLAPQWTIDTTELTRQLASWRAGRYQESTNAWDGFVPVWSLPYRLSTNTYTAVLYVDAASTNPLPPYASMGTAAQTLQDAVDAAPNGAVIRVASGIYCTGATTNVVGINRVVLTKPVTLESIEGPEATMILGESEPATRCVYINHPQAVLRGFTLAYGFSGGLGSTLQEKSGGGLLALNVQEISSCVIDNCSALPWGSGGGMALFSASGLVNRVEVKNSEAAYGGGVAIYWGSYTRFRNGQIHHNTASVTGGGLVVDNCPNLINLLIHHNDAALNAGGASLGQGSELWHGTVVNNASASAGGILLAGNGARVGNSIVYYNSGGNLARQAGTSGQTVLNSCSSTINDPEIAATNLLTTIPQFINPLLDDYRLRSKTSPLIDAGMTRSWSGLLEDLDGAPRLLGDTPDMGAYEHAQVNLALSAPTNVTAGQVIHLTIEASWPEGLTLGALNLDLDLPSTWTLTDASGDAMPVIHDAQVVFLGKPDSTGITAVATIQTDYTQVSNQAIAASMTWQLSGMTEALTQSQQTMQVNAILPSGFDLTAFASAGGVTFPEFQIIPAGSNGTLTITADPYHQIDVVMIDAQPLSGISGLTSLVVTITNLQADTSVYAYFRAATTTYGVPLSWLAGYGLTNQSPEAEAQDDADGDDMANWEEYLAGTSPLDPASLFVFDQSHMPEASQQSILTWPSVSGRIYHIQIADELTPAIWTPLATNLVATPPENSFQVPPAGAAGAGFYRILVEPAP